MALSFNLSAGPDTDIWKKPPSHDVFNAPFKIHSSDSLCKFRSATITFTTHYTKRYDQAGLLFRLTHPAHPRKWIKTGIELYEGSPRLSTVACDNWADWSVGPVSHAGEVAVGKRTVTLLVDGESDENGRSWWVYHLDGETKTPLREITWVGDGQYGEWTLDVAALVARPAKEDDEKLNVKFEDFDVKWA